MKISDRNKLLILLAIIVIGLYFYYNGTPDIIHNEGKLTYDSDNAALYEENIDMNSNDDLSSNISSNSTNSNSTLNTSNNSGSQDSQSVLQQKMVTRDSARNTYKTSAYNTSVRGGKSQGTNLDKFFTEGNPFGNAGSKDFVGDDDVGSTGLANYTPGVKKIMSTEDKFNSGELLPNENSKDWFDDVQATTVKNRHLINIYRPVAVNTIVTTNKNPSHDIRGTPPNPKTVVSPWMNSSYEPNFNIKNNALCY